MTYPDAERVWSSAEPRFWFEGGAAKRKPTATEFYGMVNDSLKQTEVDWKIRVGLPVKPDVIADRRLTVAHRRYKTEQLFALSYNGEPHVVAEPRCEGWKEGCRKCHKPDARVTMRLHV